MERYEFLDHTADKGVDVWAGSREALFEQAAFALFTFMTDLGAHQPERTVTVEVTGVDLESLFVSWLSDLVYEFDVNRVLPVAFKVEALEETRLTATLQVLTVSEDEFEATGALVKAITYHGLVIEPQGAGWHARYYVDV